MLSLQELRQLSASLPLHSFQRQLGPFALIQRPPHAPEADLSQQRTQVAPTRDISLAMTALLFTFDDLRVCTLPPLAGNDSLSVGRLPDCDLLLDDTTVSKHHALLRWSEATAVCTVQDQGSTNGTYLNASHLGTREVRLQDGDLLGFGDVAFWFLLTETLHARLRQGPPKLGLHTG